MSSNQQPDKTMTKEAKAPTAAKVETPTEALAAMKLQHAKREKRLTDDGCIRPSREIVQDFFGFWIEPVGRPPRDFAWDRLRGVWAPSAGKHRNGLSFPGDAPDKAYIRKCVQENRLFRDGTVRPRKDVVKPISGGWKLPIGHAPRGFDWDDNDGVWVPRAGTEAVLNLLPKSVKIESLPVFVEPWKRESMPFKRETTIEPSPASMESKETTDTKPTATLPILPPQKRVIYKTPDVFQLPAPVKSVSVCDEEETKSVVSEIESDTVIMMRESGCLPESDKVEEELDGKVEEAEEHVSVDEGIGPPKDTAKETTAQKSYGVGNGDKGIAPLKEAVKKNEIYCVDHGFTYIDFNEGQPPSDDMKENKPTKKKSKSKGDGKKSKDGKKESKDGKVKRQSEVFAS